MFETIPPDWRSVLSETLVDPRLKSLEDRLTSERAVQEVYPEPASVFAALRLTPFGSVRAVILGQDPYFQPGQAEGLAFSVPAWVAPPPTLQNILAELASDLGDPRSQSGSLEPWARNGVLLLNTVLTVRRGEPASHSKYGWQVLTEAIISAVNAKPGPVAFILWGVLAQEQSRLIDRSRHVVVESAHPSPRSAYRGFVGSRPFGRVNEQLVELGATAITWHLGTP